MTELFQRYPETLHANVSKGLYPCRPGRTDTEARIRLAPHRERMLLAAIEQVESNGRADAVSPKGAIGVMQVMPSTGAEVLGSRYDTGRVRDCLLDPKCNRWVGRTYLHRMNERMGRKVGRNGAGSRGELYRLTAALVAYNAGPKQAERWLDGRTGIPLLDMDTIRIDETRRYVRNVWRRQWDRHAGRANAIGARCPWRPPQPLEMLVRGQVRRIRH